MLKGFSGHKHSKESIGRMIKSRTGLRRTDVTRGNMRIAQLGKKHSEATKEKIRKFHIGSKLTEEAKRKIGISSSARQFGKNNPAWKGGISTENNKTRNSLEMRLWRKSVFVRDDFTCQKSGERGGKLEAHHINNFADFPELRFAIDNGITLSEKKHKEFHKIYGNKNNTREQLIDFLNK